MIVPWLSFSSGDNRLGVRGELINWYEEPMPEEGARLVPTPGLGQFIEGLGFPIRGMFQRDNAINGDLITVSGQSVYRTPSIWSPKVDIGPDNLLIGNLPDAVGEVTFASTVLQTVLLSNGVPYNVQQGSVTAIPVAQGGATADGPIVAVVVVNNRHVYVENSGGGRLWWSAPLDAANIQGFATLESSPDGVLTALEQNGTIAFFGTNTIELWGGTSSDTVPFTRRGVLDKGVLSGKAIVKADFGIFIVGDDAVVYRLSNFSPQRVTTHGIEALLEEVRPYEVRGQGFLAVDDDRKNVALSAHAWSGHQFIQLDVPNKGSFLYDIATGKGHQRRSNENEFYTGRHYVRCWGMQFVGSRDSGDVYVMHEGDFREKYGAVTRVATMFLPIEQGTPHLGNLAIDTSMKDSAEDMQDKDGNPIPAVADVLSLSWSHNRGVTFGNPITRNAPLSPEDNRKVIFGPLGRGRSNGVLFRLETVASTGISLGPARLDSRRF